MKKVINIGVVAVCTLAMALTFSVVKPVVHNDSLTQAQAVEVNPSTLSNDEQCDAFVAKNPDAASQMQNMRIDDGETLTINNRAVCDQYHNTVLADVLKERPVYKNLMKDSGVEKVTGFTVKNANTGAMMNRVYINYCHNESLVPYGCSYKQVELKSASWDTKNAGTTVSSGDLRQYGVQEGDWVQLKATMVGEPESRKSGVFQYGYNIKPQVLHDKDGNPIATGFNEIETQVKSFLITGTLVGEGGFDAQDNTSLTIGFPLLDRTDRLNQNGDKIGYQYTVTDVVTYEDLVHAQAGHVANTAIMWLAAFTGIMIGTICIIIGAILLATGAGAGLGLTFIAMGIAFIALGVASTVYDIYKCLQDMEKLIIRYFTPREVFAPYIRVTAPYIVESYVDKLNNVSQTTATSIAEKLRSNTVLTADEIAFGVEATDADFANLQIGFVQLTTASMTGYISCNTLYATCFLFNNSTKMLDFSIDDTSVSPTVQGKWHYRLGSGSSHQLEGFTYTRNESFNFSVNAKTMTSPYTAYACPEGTTLRTVDTDISLYENMCVSNQYGMPAIPASPYTEYVYGEYQVVDIINAVPVS
jgi:hypothetical protein